MCRDFLTVWVCVGCLFLTLSGCGGGDSEPAPVAPSDSAGDQATPGASASPSSGTMMADSGMPDSGMPDSSTQYMDDYPTQAPMSGTDVDSAGYVDPGSSDSTTGGYDTEMAEEYAEQMRRMGEAESYDGGMSDDYMEEYGNQSPDGAYDPSGGMYDPSGMPGGRGPAKPLTYADQAQQAFQQGDDSRAIQLLMAHALTAEAEEAKSLLDKMGFNAHVKRPSFAVRWGVGIEYVPPKGYTGSVFPIGTPQNIGGKPARGATGGGYGEGMETGGMGPMMGEGGGGAGGASALPQPVKQLTGELGETIVEQFTLRLERGDYGEVLKTASAAPAPAGSAGYGMGYEGYESGAGYDEYGSGAGYAPGQMAGPGAGFGGAARPGGQTRGPRSVIPGVTLIDIGTAKDLLAKAKEAGVDVLCVFRISIKLNPRMQQVINETSFSLFDVASGKEVFSTKPLNNIQVQVSRAEGKPDDVAKTLVSLFEHVDQNWRLGPLPPLDPEQVLNRLRTLISEPATANPLPALTEVRMYHSRGLLQDEHLLVAYQQLLNDNNAAALLATGTEEEKKEVIDKLVSVSTAPSRSGPRDILQGTDP